MAVGLFVFGAVLVGLGVWGFVWAHKRRFERTNAYGVQEFASHGAAMKSNVAEGLAKGVGGICLVVGVFSVMAAFVAGR